MLCSEELDGLSGALEELLKLKTEGKLRFIGVSGILPNLIEQVDSGVFDIFQIPYSALQREHEHIIAKASDAGGGIIIRGGVARGAPTDWNKRYYMLSGDEPYPLYAWKAQFERIRKDINDAIRLEVDLTSFVDTPERQASFRRRRR